MKTMILIIAMMFLASCATISYERNGDYERLVVNSLFKSLKGLNAKRKGFTLSIEHSKGEVLPEDIANALRIIKPL